MRIILASASPRRCELLKEVIGSFDVVIADLDEAQFGDVDPRRAAIKIAIAKADAIAHRHPDALVIAGDTIVASVADQGYEQLAKPHDEADACRMLRLLSGNRHLVITGIALRGPGIEDDFADETWVTFRPLS